MLDLDRLNEILDSYKEDFVVSIWPDEKYKWQAIQHFQQNWDVNAQDFASMAKEALRRTGNLLSSQGKYPRGTLIALAETEPEAVRSLFIELFDEQQDIVERIMTFKEAIKRLLVQHPKIGKNHFHDENTITTYLWLRYPNKYYLYKYSIARAVSKFLNTGFEIKQGEYVDNIRNSIAMYDALTDSLSKNKSLISLFRSQLCDDCYPDPELRTLAVDVGFYIYQHSKRKKEYQSTWGPKDYSPQLSVKDWVALLHNPKIFTSDSLAIIKRIAHLGGTATCTQLSQKFGETKNFYNRGVSALGERIFKETGCPLYGEPNSRYWPVAFAGKRAPDDIDGYYIWKIREELAEALQQVDLSDIPLYAPKIEVPDRDRQYWWLNANPKLWSFSSISVGQEIVYTLHNERGNKRRIFQNFLNAKVGDLVIGYESTPTKEIVALLTVSEEQDGEQIVFKKIEGFVTPIPYDELQAQEALQEMEFFTNAQGTFFSLADEEYEYLMDLIRERNSGPPEELPYKPYTKENFLQEVYMAESSYERLVGLLQRKKNIILQGPPGTGKTYAARRLAYSMIGVENPYRVGMIQFHQNYSYEDFILGYKPVDETFKLRTGIFYQFCMRAKNEPDKEFFFIIDEINRGNLSKIFGELLMLIESDYRNYEVPLAYDSRPFSIPDNLYLIGMMNTADRSLAMIDYALRRRFSFFEMRPSFDSKGFRLYQEGLDDEIFDQLMLVIKELNNAIEVDGSLGAGFAIGHSYFCNLDVLGVEELYSIVDYEILPLLREYWFDDDSLYFKWENQLLGVFQ